MAVFLVMPGKPSFGRLDFNVSLQYRKSCFREETSRCQAVIKTPQRQLEGTRKTGRIIRLS